MFQMEHYSMRCRTKDHLILEDIYNQFDSGYYISYESKISLMLVLHILQGEVIVEIEHTHLISMLIGDLLMKIAIAVSVSCWVVL